MKYENKQSYCNTREDYSECLALQDLLRATSSELSKVVAALESGKDDYSSFTINIGGKSIAFNLGGPQAEALFQFIRHIEAENGYDVDFDKQTVDGWY